MEKKRLVVNLKRIPFKINDFNLNTSVTSSEKPSRRDSFTDVRVKYKIVKSQSDVFRRPSSSYRRESSNNKQKFSKKDLENLLADDDELENFCSIFPSTKKKSKCEKESLTNNGNNKFTRVKTMNPIVYLERYTGLSSVKSAKCTPPSRRQSMVTTSCRTPKHRRKSTITPLRQSPIKRRESVLPLPASSKEDLVRAQSTLHVGAVPDTLPCRENEFAEIFEFAVERLKNGGGCMYISGVPGTGKTATVMEVVRSLRETDLEFTFAEINGMRLTEPKQAYVHIRRQLMSGKDSEKRVSAEQALEWLDSKFSKNCKVYHNDKPILLLVDELDMLWNRKQSVLYNIFDWPNRQSQNLVVLAIANTMDLPERMLMKRVASRLGHTRLTFAPYSFRQLQEIVASRLKGIKDVFDPDAVQLVARKVASLSGDARRALDICRRSVEIAASRNETMVTLEHVTCAHGEMFTSPKIVAIRSASLHEQMFLRAIIDEFLRIGREEATLDRAARFMNDRLCLDGLPAVDVSEVYGIVRRLAATNLILAEPGYTGLRMRIWLNVSQDDVLFALQSTKT